MSRLDKIALDATAEQSGRWVTYDYRLGLKLRIARLGNKKYTAFLTDLKRPIMEKLRGRIDLDVLEPLLKKAAARFLLTDWEGFDDDSVEPIPVEGDVVDPPEGFFYDGEGHYLKILKYTPELGEDLFSNPMYRDLYQFVQNQAADGEEYRVSNLEDAAGN